MDYFAAVQAFVRTVDLGSFSKAAVDLDVKVSTVSRYVTRLEADLGAALLNRSTRRLHLTEAGQTFYDRATRILLDLEEAQAATRSLNARPQGLLRATIPSAFGRRHILPHVKDFLAAYPDIRLDLGFSDATLDLIDSGIDVAVRIGALVDSTLIAKRLARQSMMLVASPSYLQARPPPSTPEDLDGHECLVSSRTGMERWYCRRPVEPDAGPIEAATAGRLRINDLEALRRATLDGLGIALLPTWLCGSDVRTGRAVAMLPDWEWALSPGPERAIWCVYPPKKIVSPKVKALLAFLPSRFGRPPYWEAADGDL